MKRSTLFISVLLMALMKAALNSCPHNSLGKSPNLAVALAGYSRQSGHNITEAGKSSDPSVRTIGLFFVLSQRSAP